MNSHSIPSTGPDSTQVITCHGTADFLAALPELVGYTAPGSLFVVFFAGKRSEGAMRIDLPASDSPEDSLDLLDTICHVLRELDYEAPAVVISSEQTFAEAGGAPWEALARRVEQRLLSERIGLRELCCLAPDGWASYDDPEAPATGRPLSEIAESPIALEARLRGSTPPNLADLGAIPSPNPRRQKAVTAALDKIAAHEPPSAGAASPSFPALGYLHPSKHHLAPFAETAAVARALQREDRGLTPRMTARLARSAAHSDLWFLLAMAVLTRPEFPCEMARELGVERFTGIPVDLEGGDFFGGGRREEIDGCSRDFSGSRSHRSAGQHGPRWSIYLLLADACLDFTEQNRLPIIRTRLAQAVAETPRELRPGLLAFSAWLWWLSGTQSVAYRHVEKALGIDPEHELALMVEHLAAAPLYPALPTFKRAA
ncbi:MAG: DUF4192 family protein [Leucobacter sp.]